MQWVGFDPVDIQYSAGAFADGIVSRQDGGLSWALPSGKTSGFYVQLTWRVFWDDYTTLENDLTTGLPVLVELPLIPTYVSQRQECVCWLVPDTLSIDSFLGDAVTVSAEFFVMTAQSLRQST